MRDYDSLAEGLKFMRIGNKNRPESFLIERPEPSVVITDEESNHAASIAKTSE